ncbi:hypothetical protein P9112_008321 [Eukaryota sp. TZLM1-RC]
MKSYLNIPIDQSLSKEKCICSNSPQLTLHHALNCSKLITSSLHDAVRETVINMEQTARISCIKEHLLKETLSLNNFGSDDRGNVYHFFVAFPFSINGRLSVAKGNCFCIISKKWFRNKNNEEI